MSENKIIKGAGGGGKGDSGGRVAVEDQDNLRSMQVANVLDLVSEGPIYGLSDGLRSIFINETPLMNSDGTMNFKNVAVEWRYGNQIQSPFSGVPGVEAETAVSVEVKHDTPIVRTISNMEADMVRVTISTPQLTEQNKENGDIHGSSVTFHIDIQNQGSGYQTRLTDTISGKTTSKYQRSYLIPFNGPGPWDIRVVRDTSDSNSSAINNSIFWDSYTSIVNSTLTYPNSAIIHTRIDSSQFNAIPNRGYGLKGLVVKIPSNYDPLNRTYTGSWDGTFKLGWTDNPAWCFYDILTNDRYGLGQYLEPSGIDKWSLYSISQYCDQKVPNGFGGYEARFRCNLYLQSREEAYTVIQNFASIFRAITYWGAGSIVPVQDRPADAVALYTHANVIEGKFTYSGSSIKQRHTVALVAWSDPKDFYRQKIEYVQDEDAVRQYGIIETNVTAFGCTSRGQAHRYGKWMLAIERYCNETVTFKAGMDSLGLYPGAIVKTADSIRSGKRMGGRIVTYNVNSITVDNPVELEPGRQYKLHVIGSNTVPKTFNVSNPPGTTDTLVVSPAVSEPLVDGAVFILAADNLVPESWKVIGVKDAGEGNVEVLALTYNESIYDFVELGTRLVLPPVTSIKVKPARPQNLNLVTYAYVVGGQTVGLRGTLSWTADAPRYYVRWRRVNGAWSERTVYETSIEIDGLTNDPHTFSVVAISSAGIESDAATLNITPSLDQVNLPDITGLSLDGPFTIESANFKWDPVSGAERYEIEVYTLNVLRRAQDIGNSLKFSYTAQDMKFDGGPWRIVKFRVRARGKFGSRSNWAEIEVGNPQIGPLQGINIQYGIKSIFFQCEKPTDPDFVGIIIWVGETPYFSPDAAHQVYEGPDIIRVIYTDGAQLPLVGGKTYYVRAAGYDNFGTDSLIVSNSFEVTPAKNAPDEGTIQSDMIADGAIGIAKFAQGIAPVQIVDSMDDPTIFLDTWNVFDKSTGKLWKWNASTNQYEKNVKAGDLEANSVIAGTIAAGAVNAREIAAGAITADKLYVGSRGSALNVDPSMRDRTAWFEDNRISFVQISDGTIGNFAARSQEGTAPALLAKETIPIDPNKNYLISGVARRSSTANGQLFFGVELLDASGNFIPSNQGHYWYFAAVGVMPGTSWTAYSDPMNSTITQKFPTTAKSMRPVAWMNYGGNVGYHEVQDLRIEQILPGTLIQDGAISTSKLTAGAVTADKILANSITGEKLVANSITGDKIAAQSITADKLAAGAISAGSIEAGSITADKIDSRNLTLKDSNGNIILGAGTNLNVARITGLGNFAYLNAINASNIGTYIASAAISSAYIANLSVTSAHIQDLVVGTQKITPGAVSTNVGGVGGTRMTSGVYSGWGVDISFPASGNNVAIFAKGKGPVSGGGSSGVVPGIILRIMANGAILSEETYSLNTIDVGPFTLSISSFTMHQPAAGQNVTYSAVAIPNGGSNGLVCQILAMEFKR